MKARVAAAAVAAAEGRRERRRAAVPAVAGTAAMGMAAAVSEAAAPRDVPGGEVGDANPVRLRRRRRIGRDRYDREFRRSATPRRLRTKSYP